MARPNIDDDTLNIFLELVQDKRGGDTPTINEALEWIATQWETLTAPQDTDDTQRAAILFEENETQRKRIKQLEIALENIKDGDAGDLMDIRKMDLKEKIHADNMEDQKEERKLKTVLKTVDVLITDRQEKYKTLRQSIANGDAAVDASKLVGELLEDSDAIKILKDVPALTDGRDQG